MDRRVDKIGSIAQVSVDDQTGVPDWITVNTGLFGMKEQFIPLAGASFQGDGCRSRSRQETSGPTTDGPVIPLRRPGDVREIASVIAFLATEGAGYVSGATWVVDGGMQRMGPQAGSHLESDDWRPL